MNEIQKLTEKIRRTANRISNRKDKKELKTSITLAFQNLNEYLISLRRLRDEISDIEQQILLYSPDKKNPINLDELQIHFVDLNKTFHEKIYSVTSALIKLLELLANEEFRLKYLTKKIKKSRRKFLQNILDQNPDFKNLDITIELLLHSRAYRSVHATHSEQFKLATTWWTQQFMDIIAIIHFGFPEGKTPIFPYLGNPYLIEEKDVFVPRHHTWVYNSLFNIIEYFLYLLRKNKS